MRTVKDLRQILSIDPAVFFAFRRSIQHNLGTLHLVHESTMQHGPRATVSAVLSGLGRSEASALVASLIILQGDDGRISPNIRAWAVMVDGANDANASRHLGIRTTIHPAQLNQIAAALIVALD